MIRITTIERDARGHEERHKRFGCGTLAATIAYAERMGWIPGNVSGTGLTIIAVEFESVEESQCSNP